MKGRAAVFMPRSGSFEIREFPLPEVEPDAVLIKITLANICGSDLHTWRGETRIPNADPDGYIFGHEMTGHVFRLGTHVKKDSLGQELREGDRVAFCYFYPCNQCWYCLNGLMSNCPHRFTRFGPRTVKVPPYFTGAFGEYYYLRPGGFIFRVPDALSNEAATAANCIVSQILFAFSQVNPMVGDKVVIQGAGGLGLYASAVAKETGATKVIVMDRLEERLQLARAFGADEVVLVQEQDSSEDRHQQILAVTEGKGADLVIEAVGLSQVLPEGLSLLRANGTLLVLGCISPGKTFAMDPTWLVDTNKRMIGLSNYDPWVLPRALNFLLNAQERYPFHCLSSPKYSLEDIDTAFREADWTLAQGRPTRVIRASIVP